MPGYLTTGKRIAYIRLRPMLAGGDDVRALFETARCQRDIRGDAYVGGRDALGNPFIGRVRAVADYDHTHIRDAWRPDWSRAVGDNKNIQPKARRHAVDLLPHRARITIHVDDGQTPARCFSTIPIHAAWTIAASLGFP